MATTCPVIKEEASDPKKTTVPIKSRGSPEVFVKISRACPALGMEPPGL